MKRQKKHDLDSDHMINIIATHYEIKGAVCFCDLCNFIEAKAKKELKNANSIF